MRGVRQARGQVIQRDDLDEKAEVEESCRSGGNERGLEHLRHPRELGQRGDVLGSVAEIEIGEDECRRVGTPGLRLEHRLAEAGHETVSGQ
jgi:hypothetical protein